MAEKRIDITAKGVNSNVTSKEKVTSVSIKQIAANVIKNKQYATATPDTKVKVTLTGFGETAVPNDSSFKRLSDQVNQTDFFLKALFKGFEEPQQAIDLFNIVVSYKRVFNEALTSTNLISKEINKVFADNFTIEQLIVFNSFKLFNEVLLSEDLSIYSLNKSLLHNISNTDSAAYTTGKNVLESQFSVDLFNRVVNYNRIFNDFSSCTDDFCEICPDDDQTATVTKVVKDFLEASELFVRLYIKPVLETQNITDTDPLFNIALSKNDFKTVVDNGHQSNIGKKLNNEFSFSDTSFRSSQKILQDINNNFEFINKSLFLNKIDQSSNESLTTLLFTKPLTSDAINSDVSILQWNAFKDLLNDTNPEEQAAFNLSTVYNDTNLSTEVTTSNFTKPLLSKTFNQDNFSTLNNFFRTFNDAISCTDDFCQICPDDDQTATVTKVLKDHGIYNDLLTFNTNSNYIDVSLPIEEINNNSFKIVFSEFTNNDFISTNSNKILNHEFSYNDVSTFNTTLEKSSLSNTNDLLDRVFDSFRTFNNSTISSTILSTSINSIQENQLLSTDDFNRTVNYNPNLISLSSSNDQPVFSLNYNLNTLTNYEDQITFNFLYSLSTQYSISESILNSPQKLILSESNALEEILLDKFISRKFEDEYQVSDSGFINNQNYFAEAYVEPGYVGSNTTI
jgi:hypothetical protein